jgi:hypothetical protein
MLSKLLIGWCLMALCVAIHAGGVTAALGWLGRQSDVAPGFWRSTRNLIGFAGWMTLLHLLEIAAWAFFYVWKDVITDLQDAFYFSSVTYTTTGYGDVVLPQTWRLVGGIESLTGILMCGWSTGFFFAVVSRLYRSQLGVAR